MGLFGKSKKRKEADDAFSVDTDSILDEEFGPETAAPNAIADTADANAVYGGIVSARKRHLCPYMKTSLLHP